MTAARPSDSDYWEWIDAESTASTFAIDGQFCLTNGQWSPVHIDPGDALIRTRDGLLLRFAMLDGQDRFEFALDHSERGEAWRTAVSVVSPVWHAFQAARLLAAPSVKKVASLGIGLVASHVLLPDPEPQDTGYYQQPSGDLIFPGAIVIH